MQLLSQKVSEQRAYVLIFGPLKSGKSTLMNSIAGSYVSEVSSLPAYPSLVFVSHGDKPEFLLTDYEGKTETYERHGQRSAKRIDTAHSQLAEQHPATPRKAANCSTRSSTSRKPSAESTSRYQRRT